MEFSKQLNETALIISCTIRRPFFLFFWFWGMPDSALAVSCLLGCVVLCIIDFTCLRFCVRVLFWCRLDFFEPLSRNELERVYFTFSLFWLVFVLVGSLQLVSVILKWNRRISSGKKDFADYMIRVDVCILRRHMSIIFVREFASYIFYLPRTLETESFIHVFLVSLFSSILLFFFFFFDFLYHFLV